MELEKDDKEADRPLTPEQLQAHYRYEIRYHALLSLAGRGSKSFPKWFELYDDMLDESKLEEQFELTKEGKTVPDRGAIQLTIQNALNMLLYVHDKQPDLDLSRFQKAIDKLAESSNRQLSADAKRVQKGLGF